MFVFSENLACFVFLLPPFSDWPFCLITDELLFSHKVRSNTIEICFANFCEIRSILNNYFFHFAQNLLEEVPFASPQILSTTPLPWPVVTKNPVSFNFNKMVQNFHHILDSLLGPSLQIIAFCLNSLSRQARMASLSLL